MTQRYLASRFRRLCCLLGLWFLIGCGDSNFATIDAVVLKNLQPVSRAEVLFQAVPSQENGSVFGITNEAGQCLFNYGETIGVRPGNYKVTITVYTQRDGTPLPSGEAGAAMITSNRVRQKNYVLKQELQPGNNSITLNLDNTE